MPPTGAAAREDRDRAGSPGKRALHANREMRLLELDEDVDGSPSGATWKLPPRAGGRRTQGLRRIYGQASAVSSSPRCFCAAAQQGPGGGCMP